MSVGIGMGAFADGLLRGASFRQQMDERKEERKWRQEQRDHLREERERERGLRDSVAAHFAGTPSGVHGQHQAPDTASGAHSEGGQALMSAVQPGKMEPGPMSRPGQGRPDEQNRLRSLAAVYAQAGDHRTALDLTARSEALDDSRERLGMTRTEHGWRADDRARESLMRDGQVAYRALASGDNALANEIVQRHGDELGQILGLGPDRRIVGIEQADGRVAFTIQNARTGTTGPMTENASAEANDRVMSMGLDDFAQAVGVERGYSEPEQHPGLGWVQRGPDGQVTQFDPKEMPDGAGGPGALDSTEANRVMTRARTGIEDVFRKYLGEQFIGNPENAQVHAFVSQATFDVVDAAYRAGVHVVPESVGAFASEISLHGAVPGLRATEAMAQAEAEYREMSRSDRRANPDFVDQRARQIQQEAQMRLQDAVLRRVLGNPAEFQEGGGAPAASSAADPGAPTAATDPPGNGTNGQLIQSESGGRWDAQNGVMGHGGQAGHFGRVQFGHARLEDAKRAGVLPRDMTPKQFMASPELQMKAEAWHFDDISQFVQRNGLQHHLGLQIQGVPITEQGMLNVAHLGGKEGLRRFLESAGEYNPADENGTTLLDYLRMGAGEQPQTGLAQAGQAGGPGMGAGGGRGVGLGDARAAPSADQTQTAVEQIRGVPDEPSPGTQRGLRWRETIGNDALVQFVTRGIQYGNRGAVEEFGRVVPAIPGKEHVAEFLTQARDTVAALFGGAPAAASGQLGPFMQALESGEPPSKVDVERAARWALANPQALPREAKEVIHYWLQHREQESAR